MLSVFLSTFALSQDADDNQHPFQLGRAYDLAKLSTWDFSTGMTHRDVLAWEGDYISPTCHAANEDCVPHYTTKVQSFTDLHEIFASFSNENSGSISGKYKSYWASLSVAEGKSSSNLWFSNSAGATGTAKNLQGCHVISDECLYKDMMGVPSPISLDPVFNFTLQAMSSGARLSADGNDVDMLETWGDEVIKHRGTHLCQRTDNGASIKMFSYADASGESMAECAYENICFGAGAYGVNLTACHSSEGCGNGTMSSAKWGSNCAAVGGDPKYITSICDKSTSPDIRAKFLVSGDRDSSNSVIEMYFMRLDTLLKQYGFDDEIVGTMGKAIDYHLCKSMFSTGVWEWKAPSDGAASECMCTRKCMNGGTLDEDTCTCTCQGDVMHGFTGPSCEDTYGHCQPGVGTGNQVAASKCRIDNMCESNFHSYNCKASEVCCLTAFDGKCCPFGSHCQCGVGNCECVAARDAQPTEIKSRLLFLEAMTSE